MAKVLWQCFNCRQVSNRGSGHPCPFCGGEKGSTRKRCKGMLHPPGGEEISLTRFSIRKSGELINRPVNQCKHCRSISRRTAAPVEVYGPIIDMIKAEGYTQRWIAQQMGGVSDAQISYWSLKRARWMQKKFFIKLLTVRALVVTQKKQQRANQGQLGDSNTSAPAP